MGKLFGTDGVRGIANKELTPELAFRLGKVGAQVLSYGNHQPVILIGKDTRISGDLLEDALASGILAMGGSVIKVGILPTPAIAYLVRYYHAWLFPRRITRLNITGLNFSAGTALNWMTRWKSVLKSWFLLPEISENL